MIAFFGASVTQQENGYVDCFSLLVKEKIKKFGFGGMHLDGAGICFISKVKKAKPSVCFIDWFSTGYNDDDGEAFIYLETIVEKLNSIRCRIIFLFLPFQDNPTKPAFYEKMRRYLDKAGLEHIDLDVLLENIPKEKILRDSIHTTKSGSKLYAEKIYEYFVSQPAYPMVTVGKTKYSDIKEIKVNRTFLRSVALKNTVKNTMGGVIIGFYHVIGQHSGIIKIVTSGKTEKVMVWDRWCYYNRLHFNLRTDFFDTVEFEITQDLFDTSACERPIDFSAAQKKLVVKSIFYIGDTLCLTNKRAGKKNSYLLANVMRNVGRLKHKVKKILINVRGGK